MEVLLLDSESLRFLDEYSELVAQYRG